MGVTKLETDEAVYYFDHERSGRSFTPEVAPDEIYHVIVGMQYGPVENPEEDYPPNSRRHWTGPRSTGKTSGSSTCHLQMPRGRNTSGQDTPDKLPVESVEPQPNRRDFLRLSRRRQRV